MALKGTTKPPKTLYTKHIVAATGCTEAEAYYIEQTIRDFPGCGTLDHLTADELHALARKAQKWLKDAGWSIEIMG